MVDQNALKIFCSEILADSPKGLAYYKAFYDVDSENISQKSLPPYMTQQAYLLMQTPEYKATMSKLKNDIKKKIENIENTDIKKLYNILHATEDLQFVIEYCKENLENMKMGYDLEKEYINEKMSYLLSKKKLNSDDKKQLEALQQKSIKNLKYPRGADKDCDVIISATNALAKIHNLGKVDDKNNAVNIVFLNDDNLDE